jgi:hypothetical protein
VSDIISLLLDEAEKAQRKKNLALATVCWDASNQLGLVIEAHHDLRLAHTKMNDEVCQRLGKALGYPWFKDDQQNFPDATEENGVCTGEHVAESIASEAANWILKVEAELNDLKKYVKLLEENSQNLSDEVENLRSDLREIYKAGKSDENATVRRMSQMAGAAFARSHING